MKFSKATNYALHTMLYLMAFAPDKPVGVLQLADAQSVSPTYLSKILTKLVKAGLIESASGANGGYRLKGKKEDISFLDIIHAVEGTVSLFECCGSEDSQCLIHQTMLAAEVAMEQHLKKTKMTDIAVQAAKSSNFAK
ncbi:RrF2 family transcriptional regulator [Paenibacillus aestuarii]|uniref:RrF2 family transcriptional regulator n=1 Tax=Paenibacillus aestuarii TaxID=516965 RepID=A0ABW0KHU7_9BACL|nr:Rrf2 family transcriptional regulator [Paenibacillus aestuarii]